MIRQYDTMHLNVVLVTSISNIFLNRYFDISDIWITHIQMLFSSTDSSKRSSFYSLEITSLLVCSTVLPVIHYQGYSSYKYLIMSMSLSEYGVFLSIQLIIYFLQFFLDPICLDVIKFLGWDLSAMEDFKIDWICWHRLMDICYLFISLAPQLLPLALGILVNSHTIYAKYLFLLWIRVYINVDCAQIRRHGTRWFTL